jgi:hypothetical protein
MTTVRFLFLASIFLIFQNCGENTPAAPTLVGPLNAQLLPPNAVPAIGHVNTVNCWIENDRFIATGICSNGSGEWQKFWLEAEPINAAGKSITISNHKSVIIKTFSDAVPPMGRTSFYISWPVSSFSETPSSLNVKVAGAVKQEAGPILSIPMTNSMRMYAPNSAEQIVPEESSWQLSGTLMNPLDLVASKPMLEILIYGKDNLLWFSTVLNPLDPANSSIFQMQGMEPFKPKETRPFTLQIYYKVLPEVLKAKKIGRVDILPYEAR